MTSQTVVTWHVQRITLLYIVYEVTVHAPMVSLETIIVRCKHLTVLYWTGFHNHLTQLKFNPMYFWLHAMLYSFRRFFLLTTVYIYIYIYIYIYYLRIYIHISCICNEKHNKSFNIGTAIIRINTEGQWSFVMKSRQGDVLFELRWIASLSLVLRTYSRCSWFVLCLYHCFVWCKDAINCFF